METPQYWVRADLSTAERIREFEATPLRERGLPDSTYAFLARSCRQAPRATAIRYLREPSSCGAPEDISFGRLLERIHQTANLVRGEGLGAGDVVSLMLPNTPQAQYALWGGQAAAVVNPINWMLEAEAIAAIVRAAGARMLMAYGGDPEIEIWDKVLRVAELCPQLRTIVRLGGDRSGAAPAGRRFLDYDAVIDGYRGDALDFERAILPDDLASLFPTGGTTGAPKLVRHSHWNEVASAWLSAAVAGIVEGESRLSATPLYHVVGAFAGSLATLARGGTLVLATSVGWKHPKLLPQIWQVVEACRVNYLTIVPTIMNQLVQMPIGAHDISCVKGVLSGSAPLSENVARRFLAMTGLAVREGYGLTETTSVCMMNPKDGEVKTGSVGLLFPYHRARVVALDRREGLRDCAPGEAGVLALSGPTVFSSYASGGQAGFLEPGWLDTGDLARIDEDGYIWITGRTKDLIIRSGHNIDPKAVEEAFYRHPQVLEAAVVARPDSYAGEVPVAYVQLVEGARIDAAQLLAEVRPGISERAAVPKDCYIMAGLPKSPVGKILKNRLREDATLRGFDKALRAAGIESGYELALESGHEVRIRLSGAGPDPQQVRDALASFTTAYLIVTADPASV
ncbi:MAG: acyl-CoA synthetase [Achromobacter sp.]|uniref:acyl-CoA synthetase n=1 Tax=Achromobacter sp. TaxID=134375 RepID=UPI002590A8FF|nr:acyl-CoA synthetase [Achromobacter sp.]MCW0211592.1 acyl-CoA synthetase [Achromobacter sp.]